jgi:hypothetical protein
VPAFLELFGAMNSGTQLCQNEACHRYWTIILKKLTAPRFLGKGFKEADHKTNRNPIEWVGCLKKQITRTHTSTFLRACRALTMLRITGAEITSE